MSKIIKLIMLLIFMVIIPIVLGVFWDKKEDSTIGRWIKRYLNGYLVMTAVFQLIFVPFVFKRNNFTELCYAYSALLVVLLCLAVLVLILRARRERKVRLAKAAETEAKAGEDTDDGEDAEWFQEKKKKRLKVSILEWIYIGVFAGLLLWQLYYAVFYDMGEISYDDFTYITMANSAIRDNAMFVTNVSSGNAIVATSETRRLLQSSLIFISYLSKVTGISVTIMAHTVMCVQLILMAYGAYWLVGHSIFKKRDNRLMFLILLEVLYIFGYYSIYSLTYRLLGPIWQGKAIIAVVYIPYLLYAIGKAVDDRYSHGSGILMFLASVSLSGMSLGGTAAMAAIIGILLLFNVFKNHHFWNLLYIIWGCAMPLLYAVVYLMIRGGHV